MELSHRIDLFATKSAKSIGIIAKIRHYVPRRVLIPVYNSLIVPYLTYGVCTWGNCALTFQRKIVNLQKRAKEYTVYSFFSNRTAYPYVAYFSEIVAIYCMIAIDKQHQLVHSISSLEQVRFITTKQGLSLASCFTLSSLEPIQCTPFSRESAPKFETLFLI